MATTSYQLAALAANVTGSWTNVNNALARDDAVATFTTTTKNDTRTFRVYNFGFDVDIPSGASITQVNLQYRGLVSSGGTLVVTPRIGATNGSNYSITGTSLTTTEQTNITRPGGGSWTRADLLDGTFEVRVTGTQPNNTTSRTYSVAWIEVEVVYELRVVSADPGSFSITGTDATVRKGYPLAADAGSFAVSGQPADLEYGRELTAEAGSFGFTGADAQVYVATPAIQENLWPNSEVLPFDAADSLNVTLSSNAVVAHDGATTAELLTESTDGGPTTHTFGEFSLALGDQVTVTPGGWYTFSFYAKAVTGTRNLLLEFYTTSGASVFSVALDTTTGAVDVSASDGYIGASKLAHSEAAANGYWRVGVSLYFDGTLTGGWGVGGWGEGTWGTETTASIDPIVFDAVYGEIRDGTTPTYTGNGSSVALWGFQINRGVPWATYSKTPSSGRTLFADPGSFTFSGVDSALELGREVLAEQGGFLVTGTAADLEYARKVAAEAGAFAFSGVDAALERGLEVLAEAGSFAFSGVDSALEYGREATADPGSYAVGGVDAMLERGYEVAADPGVFAFNGTDATLIKAAVGQTVIVADAGAFVFDGVDAGLEYGFELAAGPGVFQIVGAEATLEQGTVQPSVPVTGGGSSAAPKDEWWRSPPGKKKRRKAPKTDTGAPTEAPLSVSERLARRRAAEEAARLAGEALSAAKDALDGAVRNKVAADAVKTLKAEAARRKRIAAAAQAALEAELEAERRAAIMADDDLVLLFAA
jgi:hypothetical protein